VPLARSQLGQTRERRTGFDGTPESIRFSFQQLIRQGRFFEGCCLSHEEGPSQPEGL